MYELSGAQYPLFSNVGSNFYTKIIDVADIDGRFAVLFTENGKGMQILKQGFFEVRDTRRLGNRVIYVEGANPLDSAYFYKGELYSRGKGGNDLFYFN